MANKKIIIDDKKVEIKKYIELKGETWSKLYESAKKELAKKVKVDGFRPGKAPMNLVEQKLSQGQIFDKALQQYLKENEKEIFEEVKKENERIVNVPTIELEAISDAEAKLYVVYPLMTDLSNLKTDKIKAKVDLKKISAEDVKKFIKSKLEANALLLPLGEKDKTQLGDTITLNYKGFVNDEPFEGGEAENFDLRLGSKTFIDTFEDQLVGKKIGHKGEVVVSFPKEYPVEKLSGQKATFNVEILDAKRPEEVKLTKDNLEDLKLGKLDSIAQAEGRIKLLLENNEFHITLNKFLEDIVKEVSSLNEVNVNHIFVAKYAEEKKKQIVNQLKQQNIKLEEYIELLGKTEAEFDKLIEKEEKEQIVYSLITNQLINPLKEQVKITEKEQDNWLRFQSLTTGFPAHTFKEFAKTNEQIKESIKSQIEEKQLKMLLVKEFDKKGYDTLSKEEKRLDSEVEKLVSFDKPEEEKKETKAEVKESKSEAKEAKKPVAKKTTKKATNKKPAAKKTTKKVEK